MGQGDRLDAATGWRWLLATHRALEEAREDIDRLNVFPVPDGDTGTNLFQTMHAALEAVLAAGSAHPAVPLTHSATALALESLLAARGNSGVILSQVLRGVADGIALCPEADTLGLDAPALARCLDLARECARHGVSKPMEGTILTVADAAADAALAAVAADAADGGAVAPAGAVPASVSAHPPGSTGVSLLDVTGAALHAARLALARTPTQLASLREAGVVDAGGAGFVVVLAALHETLGGAPLEPVHVFAPVSPRPQATGAPPVPNPPGITPADGPTEAAGPRPAAVPPDSVRASPPTGVIAAPRGSQSRPAVATYEVMYVLRALPARAHDALRTALDYLGDSVLVAGDERATTVHVHTRDAGAAVEAAYAHGRPERVRITFLGYLQEGQATVLAGTVLRPVLASDGGVATSEVPVHSTPSAVLACAPGPRLAQAMAAAGAWVVLSAPGRRATTGDLLGARRLIPSAAVVVLANHDDTLMAAQMMQRLADSEGLPTHLVKSRAAVAGLAALAVHDPMAPAADNERRMAAAAEGCRTGQLLIATQDMATSAGLAHAGDAIGYVERQAVCVDADVDAAADALMARLLRPDSELLTLVSGSRGDAGEPSPAHRLAERLRAVRPDLEMNLVPGDPERYVLLLGVE